MKPDKFDIKIQEAVEQNEPDYDEQSWNAIEKLLDKEMPQKKKDKRKIFWLFFLLFIGTAGILLMMRYSGIDENSIVSIKRNKINTSDKAQDSLLMKQKKAASKSINENAASTTRYVPESRIKKSPSEIKIAKSYMQKKVTGGITNEESINIFRLNNMTDSETNFQRKVSVPGKNGKTLEPGDLKAAIEITRKDSPEINENITTDAKAKGHSIVNKKYRDTSLEKNATQQPGNKFGKSFLINFSIGPDVSAVNIKDIGKVEPLYGVGFGYEINKRWTVRTGFYVERKVYDAAASEYHPPLGFWNYYPDLKYIDADCKIFEVPLIINYNFSQTLKSQWFGSVGISSYFMKKEDYDYLSKTPSGQVSYDSYNIKNQNQNYFSSIKLSAGYEKKLGNSISVIAEPYINYPLSGVGYGKVKLYSAGILFSLNVKPFSKK